MTGHRSIIRRRLARRTGDHAGVKPRMPFRFERDGGRQGLCLVAPAELNPHWSAHQARWRVEDVLERADVLGAAAKSRMARKSLARPSVLMSRPSVVRVGAVDDVVEPQSSASRVVCRGLEWPQAVSGSFKSAATLTHRTGGGASCCALGRRARSVLHEILNRRGGVATDRHVR
jgi:hypothetical protein